MIIKIHRGLEQIGGCITKIENSAGQRIIIDLGHNLPKLVENNKPEKDNFVTSEAIEQLTTGVSAIFYTHYHSDHIGLFHLVPDNVPQYLWAIAKEISVLKYQRLSYMPEDTGVTEEVVQRVKALNTYLPTKKITIGDFIITPYFVSHSAADAYMFLVEADGKRLLHMGDFRGHSVIGEKLIPTIKKYITTKPVHALIIEGTMLGRSSERVYHEKEVSEQISDIIGRYKNVFIQCSSTDIERLSSIYYANRKHKKPILCDSYQKQVTGLFPKISDGFYQYPSKNNSKLHKWIEEKGFTMIVRTSDTFDTEVTKLLQDLDPRQTAIIYSMWKGYVNHKHSAYKKEMSRLLPKFDNIHKIHTSGHATVECLAEVCKTVNPRVAIIPIHKEKGADFSKIEIPEELKSKICTEGFKEI